MVKSTTALRYILPKNVIFMRIELVIPAYFIIHNSDMRIFSVF